MGSGCLKQTSANDVSSMLFKDFLAIAALLWPVAYSGSYYPTLCWCVWLTGPVFCSGGNELLVTVPAPTLALLILSVSAFTPIHPPSPSRSLENNCHFLSSYWMSLHSQSPDFYVSHLFLFLSSPLYPVLVYTSTGRLIDLPSFFFFSGLFLVNHPVYLLLLHYSYLKGLITFQIKILQKIHMIHIKYNPLLKIKPEVPAVLTLIPNKKSTWGPFLHFRHLWWIFKQQRIGLVHVQLQCDW